MSIYGPSVVMGLLIGAIPLVVWALVHRRRRLRNARSSAFVEQAADAIIGIDAQGAILDWNAAAQSLFAWRREEVVGRKAAEVLIPARHRAAFRAGIARFVETRSSRILGRTLELPAMARGGEEIGVEVRVTAANLDGSPTFSAHLRDLWVRGGAAAKLEEERDVARARSRLKSQVFAHVSHEVRTPVNALVGWSERLAGGGGTSEQRSDWARRVRRNSTHPIEMLDRSLELARMEGGDEYTRVEEVDLPRFIRRTLSMLEPLVGSGVSLAGEWRGEAPTCLQTDPLRLREILVGLIGDGLRRTTRGRVTVFVDSDAPDDPEARLRLTVQDEGPEIGEAQFEALLEPLGPPGLAPSPASPIDEGLGLAISRRIARVLGGDLVGEALPGRGNRFTLWLALGECGAAHWKSEVRIDPLRTEATEATLPIDLRGRAVLVADDTEDGRRLMEVILEDRGALVRTAPDGQVALEEVARANESGRPFDLIIMDMSMPVLDGFEAMRRLRSLGESTPILALTAFALSGDSERCFAAGCDYYLTRPVDEEDLDVAILALLPNLAKPLDSAESRSPQLQTAPSTSTRRERFVRMVDSYRKDLPELIDALTGSEATPAATASRRSGSWRVDVRTSCDLESG